MVSLGKQLQYMTYPSSEMKNIGTNCQLYQIGPMKGGAPSRNDSIFMKYLENCLMSGAPRSIIW